MSANLKCAQRSLTTKAWCPLSHNQQGELTHNFVMLECVALCVDYEMNMWDFVFFVAVNTFQRGTLVSS